MKKILFLFLCLISPVFAEVAFEKISNFGWDLFHTAAKNNKNTVFSPYSIYYCLSMTAAGAQGDTLAEMTKVLSLPSNLLTLSDALTANNASLQGHLKVASSLWIAPQFVIRDDFRKTIEDNFHAHIASLDFSSSSIAASTINQWIAQNTNQKITDLLKESDLEKTTRLVLANALYFSGKFLKPFNPTRTSAQNFWIEEASAFQIPMMEQTSVFFYTEDDTFQTVALPMEASQIALVVFLPKEKIFSGLSAQMTFEKFKAILGNLGLQRTHLKLPKFTLKERFDLRSALTQLGLSTAFTPQANFSGMDGKLDLFLSKVLHEAYFALDESGVVAAAATAAAMNTTAVAATPKEFIADHPFIFGLVDLQTKIPLFLGELTAPP